MNKDAFDEIDKILKKIFIAEHGLKKLILANKTGLTIAHASDTLEHLAEMDDLGTIAALVYGASENFGESLDLGPLNMITLDFKEAKISIVPCGEGILCFYSDKSYCMVKLLMGVFKKELLELINSFLTHPEVEHLKIDEFLSEIFLK
ncbi:MAG: roadblock/LC7 domain-containing protein [Candidatus Helarchaeota archaeon]